MQILAHMCTSTIFSPEIKKYNTIRHIVRLRQTLLRWRRKAAASSAKCIPYDVPAGHVAICVGSECKRFIVRAKYLNHPIFRKLLLQAEEEYGFAHEGPLSVPCEESVFEEILRSVSRADSASKAARCGHFGGLSNNRDILGESRPMLRG